MVYIAAILGGILAGIINTLAGSGSLVTLPILVALGLPADVANGTNRVGIVFQCAVGVWGFRQEGNLETRSSSWYVIPTLLGSILGAMIAVELSAQVMNFVIGVIMVIMLVLTLINPKKWLRETSERFESRPPLWLPALFFVIGIYGGFLQAGVGVMLLVALVLGARYAVAQANGVKLLIALCFSSVALVIFAFNELVYWPFGFLMAIGQAIGAWLGVRFLSRFEGATLWVRRLLIVVITLGAFRFLGVPLLEYLGVWGG